jgi:succinyl-CoA synthetase alpha subunit
MSILAGSHTKVIVQGITGSAARLHTKVMLDYGTQIVAGARPGAAGEVVCGVPVYNTVEEALLNHQIDASVLFVPGRVVKNAAEEALDAGIRLLVIVAERVPLHDTITIVEKAEEYGATIIGPNTPGLISPPEHTKLGFVPSQYYTPGPIGVASRSGTLTYEIVSRLTSAGIGQTTCVGVGGDPIVGLSFPRTLALFEKDKDTDAILLICEIGGTMEEEASELVKRGKISKPIFAYIAGRTAPVGKRVGHAGAIIEGNRGTIESKLQAFEDAGIPVAFTPADVIGIARKIL